MSRREAGRFVVVVLDGFGVGEMPDVPEVRPQDKGSNTCLHIFEKVPELYLPTLEELGLVNIAGQLPGTMRPSGAAVWGKAMLRHHGADTFFGHQEIMGTNPRELRYEQLADRIDEIERTIAKSGFAVQRYKEGAHGMLIVDECVTIADNIECDPGQAINVTAAIDDIEFDRVLKIGRLVRSIVTTPRVIAFGGRGVRLTDLLRAVEIHGDLIGVNAPASGVYNNDYHCIHMGYGVDAQVQAPTILGKAGVPVFLLGKVADVVANDFGTSISWVDTAEVLAKTAKLISENSAGFFCVNVQETDLCGHRENAAAYAQKLEEADKGIAKIIELMSHKDILIVMADHGNDPTIGHPHHTRELVPLMIRCGIQGPVEIGVRKTLADVGTTACDYFDAKHPESGESYLNLII